MKASQRAKIAQEIRDYRRAGLSLKEAMYQVRLQYGEFCPCRASLYKYLVEFSLSSTAI